MNIFSDKDTFIKEHIVSNERQSEEYARKDTWKRS